jgi:glycosyltransferase involved in cell wall biosynthesis
VTESDTGPLAHLPTISIVTPSLNQADYLEETLLSVLEQGYPSLEYIVMDGASTDGSVGIIKRYETRISYWASEPDAGHASALNKGFAMTKGDIMGWLNSSDVYYPWTFKTVAEIFLDLPEVEWIQGIPSHVDVGSRPRTMSRGFCNRYDLLAGHGLQQESVFWRRSLWQKAGGRVDDSLPLACDYELWLRFSRYARLYQVGTLLAGFRFHENRRGSTSGADYGAEAQSVRDREFSLLTAREKTRVRAVDFVLRVSGRQASMVLDRVGVPRWYRHARVDYDFSQKRWRAA